MSVWSIGGDYCHFTHCKDDHQPSKRIGMEGGSCDLFQGTILVFVQRLGKTSNNVKIASDN